MKQQEFDKLVDEFVSDMEKDINEAKRNIKIKYPDFDLERLTKPNDIYVPYNEDPALNNAADAVRNAMWDAIDKFMAINNCTYKADELSDDKKILIINEEIEDYNDYCLSFLGEANKIQDLYKKGFKLTAIRRVDFEYVRYDKRALVIMCFEQEK